MKKWIAATLILLCVGRAEAFLRADGKKIVDAEGRPVLLRGMNLGGWLVPEGYMLHISGYGSPSSIRKMIVDLVGSENAEAFYREYEANYVTEEDIARIASWGMNSIRLPFNYRMLSPEDQPGVFLEEGFAVFDRVLEWCRKYRLYLILDMHCAPGGQNAGNISDSDGKTARLWTTKANQDRTVEIWRKIAERYADEVWIGGYDLLNEPVLPSGYSNSALRSLYRRIAEAIREVDKNHLLFIEGNWYATDFNQLGPPIDNNMAYSFHKYWSSTSASTIQSYLALRTQQNVPLWLGESGENSNPWYSAVVQLSEKNDIGWCWWTHKKVETISSPFSAPLPPAYDRVLKYWSGEGAKPTVDAAMNGLLEMARGLKLENCTFLPDVIDALTRPDFSLRTLPYRDHRLPGFIAAVDYDMGAPNKAYKDSRSENTEGTGGNAWNNGWKYRNDGVDIEACRDVWGAPYNIGWIDDGEWQSYTVTADKGGIYDIELRVAAVGAGGQAVIRMDGLTLGAVSVPNTGGWQTWRTLTITDVAVEKGTHSLMHLAQRGGYNFSGMRFILKQESTVEKPTDVLPSQPKLVGPFPNPFNETVVIPFYLPQRQFVRLEIYDVSGRLVKRICEGDQGPGACSLTWNGSDEREQKVASGIYLVKLSGPTFDLTGKTVLQK